MATYEEFQEAVRECCELEERMPVVVETVRVNGLPSEWIDRVAHWSHVATVYLQERAVTLDGMLEHFNGRKRIPPMDSKELEWMRMIETNSNLALSSNLQEKSVKFVEAVKSSNSVLLEFLMIDSSLDPSMKDNWAARYLVRHYDADIFCILLKDARIDPTVDDNRIYNHVSKNPFNRTLMERLVQNPHVNVSVLFERLTRDSNILADVVVAEVVEFVATIPGVALRSADIDTAIHLKSLPLLNECLKLVAPTFEQLGKACDRAYIPVIDRLLQDGRIDQDLSPLFLKACKENRLSVAERLIQSPNVDPGTENNLPLRVAATWGNIEIVALLMSDKSGRVDVSANGWAALKMARGANHTKIIELLMSDPFALEPITDFAAPVEPHIDLREVEPYPGFMEIPDVGIAHVNPVAFNPVAPVDRIVDQRENQRERANANRFRRILHVEENEFVVQNGVAEPPDVAEPPGVVIRPLPFTLSFKNKMYIALALAPVAVYLVVKHLF